MIINICIKLLKSQFIELIMYKLWTFIFFFYIIVISHFIQVLLCLSFKNCFKQHVFYEFCLKFQSFGFSYTIKISDSKLTSDQWIMG